MLTKVVHAKRNVPEPSLKLGWDTALSVMHAPLQLVRWPQDSRLSQ